MDERPGPPPSTQPPAVHPRDAATLTSRANRTNGKAIASLVLGIVGVTGIPFVASVIAIVLGHMARKEIAHHGEEGRGLATAGIILGWVGVVLVVLGVLLVSVLFLVNFSSASVIAT